MSHPTIGFYRLPHGVGIALPEYETTGSAGMDLRAAIGEDDTFVIPPTGRTLVPTGFIFEIPQGFEVQIRPRSGLALKHGVTCLNTPGTIDSYYRGEVKIILVNLGQEAFKITRGMRVAQMVVAPVVQAKVREIDALSETVRGTGGFGSTGTS
jgi:dUTP pyrophosphatase